MKSPTSSRVVAVKLAFVSVLFAAPLSALPQKLQLAGDIQALDTGAVWHDFLVVEHGGWVYFTRDVAGAGSELYRTQGTSATVELVKDIQPGPAGSRPDQLTVHNGALYFFADDGVHGYELWRSDGTAAGTQLVLDIRPGGDGSFLPLPGARRPMVSTGGFLYFGVSEGTPGSPLWRSDGTAGGTHPVAGLTSPGLAEWENVVEDIVAVGSEVFFSRDSRLYKASATGTLVKLFADSPVALTAMNGQVYFQAAGQSTGDRELWKSDGTPAGTLQLVDIYPGTGTSKSSYPSLLTVLGSELFFTADDGVFGRELWKSDGTAAGTVLVRDIHPGAAGSVGGNFLWRMAIFGGKVWFAASSGAGFTLWGSDGTAAGTQPAILGAGAPELALVGSLPSGEVAGPTLYFAGSDAASGKELWRTDGSAGGTAPVLDLAPGSASSSPTRIVADGAGGAFFLSDSGGGPDLRRTDGSAPGTILIADGAVSDLPITADALPRGVLDLYGRVLCAAKDGISGNELWAASAPLGVELLADINPGDSHGFHTEHDTEAAEALKALRVGRYAYFFAYAGNQIGLWRTDGTVAGTTKIYDFDQIFISGGYYGYPFDGALVGKAFVFKAYTQANGFGVWRSDGTTAGTWLVKLTETVVGPRNFTRVGNEAVFAVDGAVSDTLWKTDGTGAGTSVLATFPEYEGIPTVPMLAVGAQVFFSADDGVSGNELWKTDGTPAGTVMVADIRPGAADSDLGKLTRLGDRAYFEANQGDGWELWRSDGTAAGTVRVGALFGLELAVGELAVAGDRLFFSSHDGLYVYEDPALTLVQAYLGTTGMRAAGSRRVFFQAGSGGVGELWSSDGTSGGTRLFDDITPGVDAWGGEAWSNPREITLSGGLLYASVEEPTKGRELRYAHIGATAQEIGVGCALSGRLPELATSDPVLGGASRFSLRDAAAATPVVVYFGAPSLPLSFGPGCNAYLNPLTALPLLSAVTDVQGAWTGPAIPIPALAPLQGLQLALQAIVGPTPTPPLGIDFSNGVLLTFGS